MKTHTKLWRILNPQQRKRALIIFFLTFIGMLMEVLGVGLVIPALAIISENDFVSKHQELTPLFNLLGNPTRENLIISGMVLLAVVYFIKALFLSFLAWKQAGFSFGIQAELSQQLFAGYMRKPYSFHLERNSSKLIHNIIIEITNITNALQQGLLVITEILVLFGLLMLLVTVEPVGTLLIITSLSLTGFLIYMITRNRILRWGEARQIHERLRLLHSQQGLSGVKDIKLLGRENEFLSRFNIHSDGNAQVAKRQHTIQQLPRFWLELLAISALVILVVVKVWSGNAIGTLLPTIGLFAAAAFRIMPSVNRILGAIQSIRFVKPVIDIIYDEFDFIGSSAKENKKSLLQFKESITLDKVSYCYPKTESKALQDISITIPHGASVGFIGGSGSGKSTLIDIILGLLTPETGTIKVDSIDIHSNLRGWQNQIGYVPQSIFLTDDTLKHNVALGVNDSEIDDDLVWKAICSAQLEDFVVSLPDKLETSVGERGVRLSGGQLQRIGVARALYHDPAILVLDESTSALDNDTENGVMEAVRSLHGKKTIIIVAHRLTTIEHCDFLYRLDKGRIVEGGNTVDILASSIK